LGGINRFLHNGTASAAGTFSSAPITAARTRTSAIGERANANTASCDSLLPYAANAFTASIRSVNRSESLRAVSKSAIRASGDSNFASAASACRLAAWVGADRNDPNVQSSGCVTSTVFSASRYGSTHTATGGASNVLETVPVRPVISIGINTSPFSVFTHTGIEIRMAGVRASICWVCSAVIVNTRLAASYTHFAFSCGEPGRKHH